MGHAPFCLFFLDYYTHPTTDGIGSDWLVGRVFCELFFVLFFVWCQHAIDRLAFPPSICGRKGPSNISPALTFDFYRECLGFGPPVARRFLESVPIRIIHSINTNTPSFVVSGIIPVMYNTYINWPAKAFGSVLFMHSASCVHSFFFCV